MRNRFSHTHALDVDLMRRFDFDALRAAGVGHKLNLAARASCAEHWHRGRCLAFLEGLPDKNATGWKY